MAKKSASLEVAELNDQLGGIAHSDPGPKLAAENARLTAELAATKLALKSKREEYCLRDIQGVLDEHKCAIMPTPSGQFAVVVKE